MSRISHGVVSSSFNFMGRYGLVKYKKPTYPTIFFGCWAHKYIPIDYNRLIKHRALGVVVWRGSDIMLLRQRRDRMRKIRKKYNLRHVAIGGYIERDLENFDMEYKSLPITSTIPKTDVSAIPDDRHNGRCDVYVAIQGTEEKTTAAQKNGPVA